MAAKKRRKRKTASDPWDRPPPRRTRPTKLSSSDKSKAKQRAKKAGRPYPNLIDNMTVAKEKRGGSRKKAAKKKGGGRRKASKRRPPRSER